MTNVTTDSALEAARVAYETRCNKPISGDIVEELRNLRVIHGAADRLIAALEAAHADALARAQVAEAANVQRITELEAAIEVAVPINKALDALLRLLVKNMPVEIRDEVATILRVFHAEMSLAFAVAEAMKAQAASAIPPTDDAADSAAGEG